MHFFKDFQDIVTCDEPLGHRTYFGMGGPAEYLVRPRTVDELRSVVRRCLDEQLPLRTLGGGCNLLIRDEGVRGVVLRLEHGDFTDISIKGTRVSSGAGCLLTSVINESVRKELTGLETLIGIPGTIGGALHMNAGGRAGDIGQFVQQATVMNAMGEIYERHADELNFTYRSSSLDEPVILQAQFDLESDNPAEILKRLRKLWILKKSEQPLSSQSAGCIFKNPRGLSAGMLIDQAGLKGTRVGGAQVSERHANFITADPNCTSQEIIQLIELVQTKVETRFGIELELEIEIW